MYNVRYYEMLKGDGKPVGTLPFLYASSSSAHFAVFVSNQRERAEWYDVPWSGVGATQLEQAFRHEAAKHARFCVLRSQESTALYLTREV